MERNVDQVLNQIFRDRRPTRWVTRKRPKIDRIACPWLIKRFIDPDAEIIFVPTADVFRVAGERQAAAFDIPGAAFSHDGEACSFDAFIERFSLNDEGLRKLAPIVRGADTDAHELAPEASGLHAVSIGLAAIHADDHKLLESGFIIYDSLYAWATRAQGERHNWRGAQS